MRIFFLLVLMFVFKGIFPFKSAAQVVINEMLASNQSGLRDFEENRREWIELYNTGEDTVNLKGYFLSNQKSPLAWKVPIDYHLAPNDFVVIFASGKDTVVGTEMHTNFRISRSGTPIFLANAAAILQDHLEALTLEEDAAYIRYPDGGNDFFYSAHPSPGQPNQKPLETWLGAPRFSIPSGFYDDGVELSISCENPNASVHYLTDGAIPNKKEAIRYEAPLRLKDLPTNEEAAFIPSSSNWQEPPQSPYAATLVRAVCVLDSSQSRDHTTGIYWLGRNPHRFPVMHLSTPPEGLFGHDSGINVPGVFWDSSDIWSGNYFQRGREWERPTHFSFINEGGQEVFQQQIGLRIHGGATRKYLKKSYRLYARRDYDRNASAFSFPFFENHEVQTFERLILRTSGHDWGGINFDFHPEKGVLFRDALMQSLVKDFKVDLQAFRPIVLYLNGTYWGIYNLRERYDAHYLHYKYKLPQDKFDLLSHNRLDPQNYLEVAAGTTTHYQAFIAHLLPLENPKTEDFKPYADIQSLIDFYITHIYFNNTDWPENNTRFWRYQKEGETDPDAPLSPEDGRWRWMVFDLDFGLDFGEAYDYEMLHHALKTDLGNYNLPIRRLLQVPEQRERFIRDFSDYLNHHFSPQRVKKQMEAFQAKYEAEIPENINRWSAPLSQRHWKESIAEMGVFAEKRPVFMRQHLEEYFNLPTFYTLAVDVNEDTLGGIQVNRLPKIRYDYPWEGLYPAEMSLTLVAHPAKNAQFSHWQNAEGREISTKDSLVVVLHSDEKYTAVFEPLDQEPSLPVRWSAPFRLKNQDYDHWHWEPEKQAGTYPPGVTLLQTFVRGDRNAQHWENWQLAYNFQQRSRFQALEDNSLAWQLTSQRINAENSAFPLAAVLSLDTRGVEEARLEFKLQTPLHLGSTAYRLKLKYRLAYGNDFIDFTDAADQVIAFVPAYAKHQATFEIDLPEQLMNRSLLQLAFFYEPIQPTTLQSAVLSIKDLRVLKPEPEPQVDFSSGKDYRIFPNPAHQVFVVEKRAEEAPSSVEELQLYDLKGRLVRQHDLGFVGTSSETISVGDLSPGLYLVKINDEVHRLVIMRAK